LERALARRENTEAALVLENAFAANLILIGTLAGNRDAVFCDEFASPGLIDVCYLSGASVNLYRHTDLNGLEDLLRREGSRARRRLVVTETLFGTSGLLAPLAALAKLAEHYDAVVIADESHAMGVLGNRGRGLTDDLPETSPGRQRIFKTSTLSKAFGSQGGFVCGPREILDHLGRHPGVAAEPVGLAVPAAAAARRALAVADEEADRRRRPLALANRLRDLLQSRGLPAGPARAQIVPVTVGDPQAALLLSQGLQEVGILVPVVGPPLVAHGMARLRISLTAGHTDAEIDRLVEALCEVRTPLI
jgi:8-amino-7-oxononanoate synthase